MRFYSLYKAPALFKFMLDYDLNFVLYNVNLVTCDISNNIIEDSCW